MTKRKIITTIAIILLIVIIGIVVAVVNKNSYTDILPPPLIYQQIYISFCHTPLIIPTFSNLYPNSS